MPEYFTAVYNRHRILQVNESQTSSYFYDELLTISAVRSFSLERNVIQSNDGFVQAWCKAVNESVNIAR